MKRKIQAGLLAAGLVVIGAAFWWLESSTRPPEGETPGPLTLLTIPSGGSESVRPSDLVATPGDFTSAGGIEESSTPVAADAKDIPTAGDILAEPDEDYPRVARKLLALAMNPRAPMEEREEALAHALNLSAGNEAELLTPAIKNPALPDSFAETILAEALNRPLAYQADLYLAALAVRKSPEMQAMIREHLAFLTDGEDRGPNPADWEAEIKAAKASWPE
jgi:hypothetical protein